MWAVAGGGSSVFVKGLTALRSDEVYDLMMKDYPEKYHVSMSFSIINDFF